MNAAASLLGAGLLAAGLACPAVAQEPAESFAERTRAAVPAAGEGYALLRCAAFYRSVLLALGPAVLGEEAVAGLRAVERRFGVAAAIVRQGETGLEADPAIAAVLDDIEALTPFYLDRYAANRAERGHSWAGDAMLVADRRGCEAILERM